MPFFKKRRNGTISKTVKVEDVFVITAMIISSCNYDRGSGPKDVTMYFLATCNGNEYYELFSGKKLDKEEQTSEDGVSCHDFDTPYVKKAEALKNYLSNPNMITIDIQTLFTFITHINMSNYLKK